MAVIRGFRDLDVYMLACSRAGKENIRAFEKFSERRKVLADRSIRRSSRAVNAMIAEAWARRRYPTAFINKIDEALAKPWKLRHGWTTQWIAGTWTAVNIAR